MEGNETIHGDNESQVKEEPKFDTLLKHHDKKEKKKKKKKKFSKIDAEEEFTSVVVVNSNVESKESKDGERDDDDDTNHEEEEEEGDDENENTEQERDAGLGSESESEEEGEREPVVKPEWWNVDEEENAKNIIFNLSDCRYGVVERAGRKIGWTISRKKQTEDDTWTVKWMDKSSASSRVQKMYYYQTINHFPFIDCLGRKQKLSQTMSRMKSLFPKFYNYYPTSFLLPDQRKQFYWFVEKNKKDSPDLAFIVKPNAESCGRGIFLTKNPEDVEGHEKCIVQEYISNPLLIEKKKFDLRVYCLIMSVCPLTIYMFQDGIVRICTENYKKPTKKNVKNEFMHFTNFTLNKRNADKFVPIEKGRYDVGNKRNFEFFRNYLRNVHKVNDEDIFGRIEDLLIKTCFGAYPVLQQRYLQCMTEEKKGGAFSCFELLGFDIMFDDKFNPWLLEVNHSPSYNTGTVFDEELKIDLISETLLLLGIDSTRRKKTFMRDKLNFLKRVKGEENERLFELVAIEPREVDYQRRVQAEELHLKKYKRIYPTKENLVRFSEIDNHSKLKKVGMQYLGSKKKHGK